MSYDNTNTGAAFLRDNPNPKTPKWSGPINVNGKDLQISIWEKTSKNGQPFLSLKVEEARNKNSGGINHHNKAKSNGYQPQDEDIPF